MKTSVHSEIGKLEGVIVHTPGSEVENMTPENIAKMPPAAQEQTRIVVAMIKQMRNVPPSNIDAAW